MGHARGVYATQGRDSVVGALVFRRSGLEPTFSEAELDFIEKFAPALSLALENAKLHANEHRIAEVLQTSLLKPVPSIPGLDIGLAYRPAHAAERVGGDFYDLVALKGELVAVVVGRRLRQGGGGGLTDRDGADYHENSGLARLFTFVHPDQSERVPSASSAPRTIRHRCSWLSWMSQEARSPCRPPAIHPLVICGDIARFLEAPHGTPLGAMSCDYGEAEFDLLPGPDHRSLH